MKNENQKDWLKNILEIPAETQTIEFKRLSEDKVITKIVETVVAMANSGVVQRDKMAKMLKNWARQGLLIQIVPPSGYFKGTKYKLPDSPEVKK